MYAFFEHWSPHAPGTDEAVGLDDRGFIAMETTDGVAVTEDTAPASGGCVRQSSKHWQVKRAPAYRMFSSSLCEYSSVNIQLNIINVRQTLQQYSDDEGLSRKSMYARA